MVADAVREEKRETGPKQRPAWRRLTERLAKTRTRLAGTLGDLLLGERTISADALDSLETALLVTDAGVAATERIVDALKRRVSRRELGDIDALRGALRTELLSLLEPMQQPFAVADGPDSDPGNTPTPSPRIILMVGVNGAGKTTTIGKLASRLQADGQSVLLAAGDTFRAAAVEQLTEWGRRNNVPVIAQGQGADSASVIHDAISAARARGVDIVLADTAGRLQAKRNLMEELRKIKRVIARFDATAPHEAVLVLDAGVGQNAVSQVAEFDAAVGLTGLIVAKLDGSARGGVLFAIAESCKERGAELPVYFIGVGEGVEDLRPFDAPEFVDALLEADVHG